MENLPPRIRSLLRQAERVEASGKRFAAAQLYQQTLQEDPTNQWALLGLARTTAVRAEQEAAYQQLLQLQPDHAEAQHGLAMLANTPGDAVWAAPKPEPDFYQPEPVVELIPSEKLTAVDPPAYEFPCYRHPNRQTSLRCYNCNNPICIDCSNKTSVGYLCPDCKHALEDKYFNATPFDYFVATVVSLPLSLIAGYLVWRMSGGFFFIFLMLFVGSAIGSLIARLTQKAVGGRRGRYLPHLVVAMMAMGVIIPGVPILLLLLLGGASGSGLVLFLMPVMYLFIAGGSAFYWMK